MASPPDTARLQEVRTLAHKLFTQCRDSPSSYKLLTTPVRKLRNVLEEAEEIFDETRTLGPDDLKLLEKVQRSGSILHQLDLALQSYKRSNYVNIREDAIADFKTILDVNYHELKLAFDAISTGEIELHLDTNILPYGTGTSKSPMAPSSSSNTDSAHDRKSSYASSAWSLVPKEGGSQESASDAMSVRSEGRHEPKASDEKELYDFDGMHLRSSAASGSTVEHRPSLDWRSPFTSDPMSMSFEQASAMILADDDDDLLLPTTTRSRSGTGSTVFVDQPSVGEETAVGLGVTRSGDEEQGINVSTATLQPPLKDYNPSESLRPDDASNSVLESLSSPSTAEQSSTSQTLELDLAVTPADSPKRRNDSVHLSPRSAATGTSRRKRNSSINSTIATSAIEETANESDESQAKSEESFPQHTPRSPSKTRSSSDRSVIDADLHSQSVDDHQRNKLHVDIPTKKLPPWPAFDVGMPSPKDTRTKSVDTPSMPTRQPPPLPPKHQRSSRAVRLSTYRITNGSPIDDPSSEDELYATSQPSSPIMQVRTAPTINTHTIIPKVSIDASACEEDATGDHEIPMETRVSRSASVGAESSTNGQSGMDVFANALRSKFSIHGPLKSVVTGAESQSSESQPPLHPDTNPSTHRRHSIAVPPSQDSPDDTKAPPLPPRPPPPPVPKRPSQQRYRRQSQGQGTRPAPANIQTSPAVLQQQQTSLIVEKELAPEPGLELRNKLHVAAQPNHLKQRISVDAALNVANSSLDSQTAASLRDATRHLRSVSTSQVTTTTSSSDPTLSEFYGPGVESTPSSELELERINHVIHFFNDCQWDQAEAYLTDYLAVLIEDNSLGRARRVNHLLGVCASFKGEWLRAIPLFLSVLRTPVRHVGELDDGDCAAAYWLGDCYSLLNQRTEALLAYCIAERSSLFNNPIETSLGDLVTAEQEAVQLGLSKSEFNMRWAQASSLTTGESILEPKLISMDTARMLFDNGPRRASRFGQEPFQLSQTQARSNALFKLTKNAWAGRYHRMKITTGNFEPNTAWPMAYDPLFNMANVHRGRLLAYECDLMAVFATNLEAKIPKAGPLGLSRMDCFTCSDLTWLIQTLRECLKMLEMEFSEVANVEGTWFVARYTFMQVKIATTYYFSIAIFKQTLRGGYGVEICPDGICSARILRTNVDHDKGVHVSESKRIKKLIREYLDEAAKQRPKSSRKTSSATTTSVSAGGFEQVLPPPIPPRPSG